MDTDFSQDRLLSERSVQRVCFPVGGTHLSLTPGRSRRGSAPGLGARCSVLSAAALESGGFGSAASPRAHGGCALGPRLPGVPLSRGRRGEAAAPRGRPRGLGPRAEGTCLTTRAGSCEAEGGGVRGGAKKRGTSSG